MFRVTFNIRVLYASVLLFIMAIQWVAGSMYLSVSYLVETTPVMNSTEAAIANDVLGQYGMQVHVRMVDEADIQLIQGLGYAAPFIHSIEVNGAINAFTLGTGETEYQHIELAIVNPTDRHQEQKQQACVDKLFAQFCFGQTQDCNIENQFVLTENNFSVISLYNIFDHSYPAPPPRVT